MRTKAEVRSYLESVIGQSVDANCGDYQGQCVSLIKGLFNFLGVPNPYIPRGNAKDAANTYVNQGIATNGDGWLRVCVNKKMGLIGGVYYGHIWIDLQNEVNYEQNGKTALRVTKNTRPITQAYQIVNLDKWITNDAPSAGGSMAEKVSLDTDRILQHGILARNGLRGRSYSLDGSTGKVFEGQDLTNKNISAWYLSAEGRQWRDTSEANSVHGINAQLDSIAGLNTTIDRLTKEVTIKQAFIDSQKSELIGLTQTVNEKQAEIDSLADANAALVKENTELKAIIASGGAGSGEDTEWLNKLGLALQWVIKRLGLK